MASIVVKCLVEDSLGHFLLIKRASNDSHAEYWETPGGGLDGFESILLAGKREVAEESGLVIEEENLVLMDYSEMEDDESGQVFSVYFLKTIAPIEDQVVDLSKNPDHSKFIWLAYDEVPLFLKTGAKIDNWTKKHLSLI